MGYGADSPDPSSPPDTASCHSGNLHQGQFLQISLRVNIPIGYKRRVGSVHRLHANRRACGERSCHPLEPRPPRQCHRLGLHCEMLVYSYQNLGAAVTPKEPRSCSHLFQEERTATKAKSQRIKMLKKFAVAYFHYEKNILYSTNVIELKF